jgi:hypothetical protein
LFEALLNSYLNSKSQKNSQGFTKAKLQFAIRLGNRKLLFLPLNSCVCVSKAPAVFINNSLRGRPGDWIFGQKFNKHVEQPKPAGNLA